MLIQSIIHSTTFKNLFFSCFYQIVKEELSILLQLRMILIFDRLGTVMGSVIQATGSLKLEEGNPAVAWNSPECLQYTVGQRWQGFEADLDPGIV